MHWFSNASRPQCHQRTKCINIFSTNCVKQILTSCHCGIPTLLNFCILIISEVWLQRFDHIFISIIILVSVITSNLPASKCLVCYLHLSTWWLVCDIKLSIVLWFLSPFEAMHFCPKILQFMYWKQRVCFIVEIVIFAVVFSSFIGVCWSRDNPNCSLILLSVI